MEKQGLRMAKELIEEAKQIEANTDANISGALIQVTADLTIDDCERFFAEWADGDAKKLKRYEKKVARTRDESNRYFSIHGLRHDVAGLLESARNPRSDKNLLW